LIKSVQNATPANRAKCKSHIDQPHAEQNPLHIALQKYGDHLGRIGDREQPREHGGSEEYSDGNADTATLHEKARRACPFREVKVNRIWRFLPDSSPFPFVLLCPVGQEC
jgi:hypothetical protein